MKVDTMVLGVAGELRVMSELMLRGFNPAKSYLDRGIDIILENGKTIQVKTSNGFDHKYNKKDRGKIYHVYTFGFQDWKNKKYIKADFSVCWAVAINSFFIVPRIEIKTVMLQYCPQWKKNKLLPYLNNWEILREKEIV